MLKIVTHNELGVTMSRISQLEKIEASLYRSRLELARALNKGASQVSQWFSGVRPIGPGLAREIELFYGLPQGWLDTDENVPTSVLLAFAPAAADDLPVFSRGPSKGPQPLPSAQPTEIESNVSTAGTANRARPVPVVGSIRGGDNGFYEELEYPVGQGDGFVMYWTSDTAAYALRVRGDSMHPRYRHGEFVVVTPSLEAQPGSDVAVRLKDGKKLLKQLNRISDGAVQLLSINNGFAPMTIDLEEIEAIHRVGGSVPSDALMPG